MRGIIYLFTRFHVLLLFLVLEIFALSLVFKSHKYQEVALLNTSNSISGKFLSWSNSISSFVNSGKNNKILSAENARLRSQIIYQDKYIKDTVLPLESDLYTYNYIPAKIVNNTVNKSYNYITINKGSDDGLHKGNGVVSSNGVVGVVTNLSAHYALVMSVISKKSFVSVRHKNSNALGNLDWSGKNPFVLEVRNMSKTIPIKKNDTIVTAGFSSIFPPDLMVGTVMEFKPDNSTGFLDIKIKPSNDIPSLSYVYIVKNTKKNELDSLQRLIQDEQ
ncbi:MAG TPA: rod shape-determining protein MreC [Chitinophagales bacterium]|nr:rod shape-determining protein MreC [Chitinophagales bacterium]HNL85353.1 rod shape-determining protein MreC [Chitinophagales bacterium]